MNLLVILLHINHAKPAGTTMKKIYVIIFAVFTDGT